MFGEFRQSAAKSGQTQQALEAYTKALEIAPNQWWIRKRRAGCFLALNQHLAAIDDLKLAIEEHPEDLSTLTWLPPEAWSHGTDSAVRDRLIALADRTVSLNNDSPNALTSRAMLYAAVGDFEHSDRDFLRAIEAEPENAARRYSLALTRLATGRIPEYQQTTAELIKLALQNPTPDTLYWTCSICSLSETALPESESLLQVTKEALAKTPENTKLRLGLAALQFRCGQYAEAEQQFQSLQQMCGRTLPDLISAFRVLNHVRQGTPKQPQHFWPRFRNH